MTCDNLQNIRIYLLVFSLHNVYPKMITTTFLSGPIVSLVTTLKVSFNLI